MSNTLASDTDIADLVAALGDDEEAGSAALDTLLADHPGDARLHFMKGSLLAGSGKPIEAHAEMSRAVELAPDFALARYQLGFFELTSGEPARALSTWGPLLAESETSYLRTFVEGMAHLIRDEFDRAIELYERGIRLNSENEPMNNDIRLLIAECRKLQAAGSAAGEGDDEQSATSLILGRFGSTPTIQ
jgi:tetratricopeptide (TPR) repeat protein